MQDDSVNDEDDNKGVDDLGLVLRAPIAVLAAGAMVVGAPIWAVMTKTKKYSLDPTIIGEGYKKKIVGPFVKRLKLEGNKSLHAAMTKSAEVSKAMVVDKLKREEDRYANEGARESPPPMEHVAKLVAIHSNFVAAEVALNGLREHLNEKKRG